MYSLETEVLWVKEQRHTYYTENKDFHKNNVSCTVEAKKIDLLEVLYIVAFSTSSIVSILSCLKTVTTNMIMGTEIQSDSDASDNRWADSHRGWENNSKCSGSSGPNPEVW